MIREGLEQLAPGRLNTERVLIIILMHDLVYGMRAPFPEGFKTNGMMVRSPRRAIYETVASAVNKMLGAIVEQKLAFLLPLEMAQQHVPNLRFCKAHWTVKKGTVCHQPLSDLSIEDGIGGGRILRRNTTSNDRRHRCDDL